MFHNFRHQATDIQNPTFKLGDGWVSGVHNLNPLLTINGITKEPLFRYKGGDATSTEWPAWGYGETLPIVAGTLPSFNQGSPFFGPHDDSVLFNNGAYYQASDVATYNLTSEDIIVEVIFKSSSIVNSGFMGNRSGTIPGWRLLTSTLSRLTLGLGSGATQISLTTAVSAAGAWTYALFVCRRASSGIVYTNMIPSSAVNISSLAALSITSPFQVALGSLAGGGNKGIDHLAYIAMWAHTGWLDTHDQQVLASTRGLQLAGAYPSKAEGTILPTSAAHNTENYIEKIEDGKVRLYGVGIGLPRCSEKKDANGNTIRGLQIDPAANNQLQRSESFTMSHIWSQINTTAGVEYVTDGYMEAPDTSAWTAYQGAVLTKETGTPYEGTQVLRVARDGSFNNPYARQDCLVAGRRVRVKGVARSGDGSAKPYVYVGGGTGADLKFTGTVSTSWQGFDLIVAAPSSVQLLLLAYTSTGTQFAEFDAISVTSLPDDMGDLLADKGFESVDGYDWLTNAVTTTISKETGTPYSGSQVIRVTSTAAAAGYGYKYNIMPTNGWYRITGWARGDGTRVPTVGDGLSGSNIFVGTAVTDWQQIDRVWRSGYHAILLAKNTASSGYVEFDDIRVTPMSLAPDYAYTASRFIAGEDLGEHGLIARPQNNTYTYSSFGGAAAKMFFSIYLKRSGWVRLSVEQQAPIIFDGYMEEADTSKWFASLGVNSKVTASPHSGTRNLRVTNEGATQNCWAYQTVLAVGRSYRAHGWARGDGTQKPMVLVRSGGISWLGTASTDWQEFEVTLGETANTNTLLYLGGTSMPTGAFVEFDDVEVTLLSDHASIYFNLDGAGSLGTYNSFVTEPKIIEYVNGWYRCSFATAIGMSLYDWKIQAAEADGDLIFAGDGTATTMEIWGAQIETNQLGPYLANTSVIRTRGGDILTFKGDDGSLGGVGSDLQGTFKANVLISNSVAPVNKVVYRLTDGGGVTDYISNYGNTSGQTTGISAATSGNPGNFNNTETIEDECIHHIRTTWETNKAVTFIDGVAGTTDTSVTIPNDLDQIHIGHGNTATQTNGIISNIKIYKRPTKK